MADSKNPPVLPEGYDPELDKANKGMAALEKERAAAQAKLDARDQKAKDKAKALMEFGAGLLGRKKDAEPVKKSKGGSISKAVMQKAGFYDKGKTEKQRQDIVKKVTTKPQRVAIVEKAFSTKNMSHGGKVGSASKRADGCAIRGKTRA